MHNLFITIGGTGFLSTLVELRKINKKVGNCLLLYYAKYGLSSVCRMRKTIWVSSYYISKLFICLWFVFNN